MTVHSRKKFKVRPMDIGEKKLEGRRIGAEVKTTAQPFKPVE
jgi:hypothetical protein